VGIELSLSVIVGILVVTTVASLLKVRRDPAAARTINEDERASLRP
jgi:tellurite resistance protein TerC